MPVTVPKPRQEFRPVERLVGLDDDEAAGGGAAAGSEKEGSVIFDGEFHSGLFGFVFDPQDTDASTYAAERTNVQFASSGWSDGPAAHGGFPLRTVIGDTPQFKLRERTQGKRICCSTAKGVPGHPRTWFSVVLPEHVPHFRPSHYRLRHGKNSPFCALRSWDLLGSRDGGRWFLLAAHRDEALLESPYAVATFRLWAENVDLAHEVVRCCVPDCRQVVAPLLGVRGRSGTQRTSSQLVGCLPQL